MDERRMGVWLPAGVDAFLFAAELIPAPGRSQIPLSVYRDLFPSSKLAGLKDTIVEVKNVWNCASTSPDVFMERRLTLRWLMSYIYMEHPFLMFLDHTQRRSTVGRTPLDERSARRRDLYLTTHNTHNRQTSMPPAGFKPTITIGERP